MTETDFDPIRALRDQLSGDIDAAKDIKQRARSIEEEITKAERLLSSTLKSLIYVQKEIEQKRDQLQKLEQEAMR